MSDALKLRAINPQDLEVFSSLLQDALCRVDDIAWLARENHFTVIFNRYRWEKKLGVWPFKRRPERVRTALHFNGILSVESSGYDLSDEEALLNLLAIEYKPLENEDFLMTLKFSAGATIRLHSECIDGVLSDISDSWQAMREPQHKN